MMGKMMGIDYITVLTWLKYWILQLPPLRQINPSRQRSLGFFFGCLRTDPFLAEARGNESVFLFSEEQNGCTKSDSHAGAAGKPGAADDSERRNVGEPRNDNDDTGNRGQRAKEFA
jgi:hypothetical protein